jgi:hypothetical protein
MAKSSRDCGDWPLTMVGCVAAHKSQKFNLSEAERARRREHAHNDARLGARAVKLTVKERRRIASIGGQARALQLSGLERSAIAPIARYSRVDEPG